MLYTMTRWGLATAGAVLGASSVIVESFIVPIVVDVFDGDKEGS